MSTTLSRLLVASLVTFIGPSGCGKDESTPAAPAPIEVNAVRVVKADVPLVREFIGQTVGAIDAEIRARVEGVITAIGFEEGKPVKEGQLLYSIDEAPFKAKVAEAQAKVAEAETRLAKAESDLKRIRPLVEMKAMSERDLDAAVAQDGAARGAVDAAKALLESANIELGYCQITSPTDGTIGLSKAKVGEFVGRAPNPVVLNTVSKLDPIHVRFSITESDFLYFVRLKQKEAAEGKESVKRSLELVLSDGSVHGERGEVASVDRQIDPKTGSLMLEASFPNPLQLLRPGLFAKVRGVAETIQGALLVPQRALRELQGQYQVFVVKDDKTVEARTVRPGASTGSNRVIEEGVAENDLVVVEGLQRLKTGTAVNVQIETIAK